MEQEWKNAFVKVYIKRHHLFTNCFNTSICFHFIELNSKDNVINIFTSGPFRALFHFLKLCSCFLYTTFGSVSMPDIFAPSPLFLHFSWWLVNKISVLINGILYFSLYIQWQIDYSQLLLTERFMNRLYSLLETFHFLIATLATEQIRQKVLVLPRKSDSSLRVRFQKRLFECVFHPTLHYPE